MFLEQYANNFDANNFAKYLSLEEFERDYNFFIKNWKKQHLFENISSNSSLRKIYDSYLKILEKEDFEIEKEIWFAKIAYQEKRKLLPNWFIKFLRTIYKKINDKNKFQKFLEVFVAYHKYFNPSAK